MDAGHRSGTLAEEVFARLRRDLVAGCFQPGSRLRMDEMCSRYGVGISPLREALSRLASHGLVTQASQRGFRVRAATAADLRDIAATRAMLECQAMKQSIARGDDAWEAGVVSAHHLLAKIDPRRIAEAPLRETWEARHREFHFAILAACGSPWLLHLCGLLYDQFDFYRRLAHFAGRRQPYLAGQHARLVAAVTARRPAQAAAVLKTHIEETAQAVARELKLDP
jgi:DNA-binding GntR family transcriptional regulator